MFLSRDRRGGINLIGIGVHPALPLIFHVEGSFLGDIAAVIPLDHAKREIDARRKSAGAGEIAVFHEPGSALEFDIWKLHRKISKRRMKRGRGFAGQQSGLGQNKRPRAHRHGHVGVLGRFTDPLQHRLARFALSGYDDDLRRGGVSKGVIGYDLHSAARMNRLSFVGNGIKAEWVIAAGNHDIAEDFPGPAKVDDHSAI